MSIWFTADLHLGSANIMRTWDGPPRPAWQMKHLKKIGHRLNWQITEEGLEAHDERLIKALNERVGREDTLWIVGDFCWGGLEEARTYLGRIRCRDVHLVWGNRDERSVGPAFASTMEQGLIEPEGQMIYLNHFPMREWDKAFHGAWHLYGHVHGRLAAQDAELDWMLTRDVGVDACDYRPVSLEELRIYMAPRFEKFMVRRAAAVAEDKRRAGD